MEFSSQDLCIFFKHDRSPGSSAIYFSLFKTYNALFFYKQV